MALAQSYPQAAVDLNRRKVTLAVLVGNRGFFPAHLAESGRNEILQLLSDMGIDVVIPPANATNVGAIESLAEAKLAGDLFRQERDKIDGVLITLPNFGDERAIAKPCASPSSTCRSWSTPSPTTRSRWTSSGGATASAAR